jgi:hypothetical protein
MKPKALLYLQTIFCIVFLCTILLLYPENVKYREQNRRLILENDSILSVNQMLRQRLDMEAGNIKKSGRDPTGNKEIRQ